MFTNFCDPLAIALAFLGAPLRRRQSPPHAPAACTSAVLAEQPFKIRPPPGRERMNFNLQCGLGLLIHLKRFHGLILSSAASRLPAFGAENWPVLHQFAGHAPAEFFETNRGVAGNGNSVMKAILIKPRLNEAFKVVQPLPVLISPPPVDLQLCSRASFRRNMASDRTNQKFSGRRCVGRGWKRRRRERSAAVGRGGTGGGRAVLRRDDQPAAAWSRAACVGSQADCLNAMTLCITPSTSAHYATALLRRHIRL